jgi:rhamnosyl/mannosyltransferase
LKLSGNMRVLHIGKYYPPHFGGMETHLQSLCEELHREIDVRVVVSNQSWHREKALIGGVEVVRIGTRFNIAGAPIGTGIAEEIRRTDPDIVHLHLPNPMAVLAVFASRYRGPLVVTYHSDVVRQRFLAKAFQPILHRILERSSAIIASSPTLVRTSPALSTFHERCRVIPFGIRPEPFQCYDEVAVSKIRRQFGSRLLLSTGRLVYYKGFEYLIQAMTDIEGRLLIIGDGPLRPALQQKIDRLGLSDRVVLLGNVPDVVPYYQACDLFVLASVERSETFGMVQLEAMACGKPVVNTRIASGVPFVSLNEVTGLTVPPRDAEALARAINCLLDDPQRRTEYGTAALTRFEREFSVEVMATRTLELYREILGSTLYSSASTPESSPGRRSRGKLKPSFTEG